MRYHDITNNEKVKETVEARKGLDLDEILAQIRRMLTVGEHTRYATNYGATFVL